MFWLIAEMAQSRSEFGIAAYLGTDYWESAALRESNNCKTAPLIIDIT
jgi:hypothetical protein